jgi:hypothetical protein
MLPPLYRWGRFRPWLVLWCPRAQCENAPASYPTFFQPYCENVPFSTVGMPWPPLRYLCRPCCDILLFSLLQHHGRPATRMPSPLLRRCSRPLLPPNPAHYWDLAPPYRSGCPCIQCRDALTVLGRMPSLTPWLCAIPYCRFAPLSSGKMSLQSMLGCPRAQFQDTLTLNARLPLQ